MIFGLPVASIIILIPLIGSLFIALTDKKNVLGIKSVSFWTSLFALCFSLVVAFLFDYSVHSYADEAFLFKKAPIKYRVGLDTLSALFVPVICFICFVGILWITKRKTQKKKTYFISILIFEALSISAFYARDMFFLFVSMESTIIPIYVIMSQRKEQSSDAIFHFLFYSMLSAILVLVSFVLIYTETKTSSLTEIYKIGVKNRMAFWLLITGIGIKMPIWPFYNWLPIAHVKSQTMCSILLASIVLKFSSLLILRFVNPLFMDIIQNNFEIALFVIALSMLFASSQLFFQDDLKTTFAYFSIIHMNSAFLILLGNLKEAGFIFSIMHHSILMAVLFFSSNIVEKIQGTRSINTLKKTTVQPYEIRLIMLFAFLFLVSSPFSWGFVSEVITIKAISQISIPYTFIFAGLILLSSLYAVYVYSNCFGLWRETETAVVSDFYINDRYKKLALSLVCALIIFIGIFPKIILSRF